MSNDLVRKAIETYLLTEDEAGAARLRFAEGLWEIQDSFAGAESSPAVLTADDLRAALVSRKHALIVQAPSADFDLMSDAVSRIADYVAGHAGLPSEQSAALRELDARALLTDEDLDAGLLMPQQFIAVVAERWSEAAPAVSGATWAFVLTAAVASVISPLSSAIAEELGPIGTDTWSMGTCPVCGASASAGRMGEHSELQGARRHLWCALCGTEWEYERLRCVRCGTRDASKLRYTYVEGDSAHRVHLCDVCHGYTRFVFEGELKCPTVMKVEDVVMTRLDAVARQAGYTPMGERTETPQ